MIFNKKIILLIINNKLARNSFNSKPNLLKKGSILNVFHVI
jgi:hypothetical protein